MIYSANDVEILAWMTRHGCFGEEQDGIRVDVMFFLLAKVINISLQKTFLRAENYSIN